MGRTSSSQDRLNNPKLGEQLITVLVRPIVLLLGSLGRSQTPLVVLF